MSRYIVAIDKSELPYFAEMNVVDTHTREIVDTHRHWVAECERCDTEGYEHVVGDMQFVANRLNREEA